MVAKRKMKSGSVQQAMDPARHPVFLLHIPQVHIIPAVILETEIILREKK